MCTFINCKLININIQEKIQQESQCKSQRLKKEQSKVLQHFIENLTEEPEKFISPESKS